MNLANMARRIAPFAMLAAATALSGCGDMNMSFNGDDGVPLAELDMSGNVPDSVVLGGSDAVVITTGDEFTVEVDGSADAIERMRFALDDGALAISRESGNWDDDEIATVLVTMPAPSNIVIGGSGSITTNGLADDADIILGGSGTFSASGIDGSALSINIGGSGTAEVDGSVDSLNVNIGGSGTAAMPNLSADRADINIGGSGDVSFASNGTVEANIGGSGTVRVRGSATCTLNSFGSGELICEDVVEGEEATEEDA